MEDDGIWEDPVDAQAHPRGERVSWPGALVAALVWLAILAAWAPVFVDGLNVFLW